MYRDLRLSGRTFVLAASLLLLAGRAAPAQITATYAGAFEFGGTDRKPIIEQNVNYAIAMWTSLLPMDPVALTIEFTLANLGADGNTAGLTTYLTKDAVSGSVASARIDINQNSTFFFDPSPSVHTEFNLSNTYLNQNPETTDKALSGVVGNATATGGAAGVWDFLSVAAHEIGHALGIGNNGGDPANYTLYSDAVTAGGGSGFDVGAQYATLFPQGKLPILFVPTTGSHFNGTAQAGVFNLTSMADPGFQKGQRSLITDIDILGVGSVNAIDKTKIRLSSVAAAPEPGTLTLAAMGLLGVAIFRYRQRRRQATR